jgi:hypothetical protein
MPCILLRTVIFLIALFVAQAFVMPTPIATRYQHATALHMESGGDADDITAARIRVKGDVQGGYYRCCVLNEVGFLTTRCCEKSQIISSHQIDTLSSDCQIRPASFES